MSTVQKPLYLEVTKDRYELPLAVADSPYELARMRGVSVYPILHAVGGWEKRRTRRSKYRVVWVQP